MARNRVNVSNNSHKVNERERSGDRIEEQLYAELVAMKWSMKKSKSDDKLAIKAITERASPLHFFQISVRKDRRLHRGLVK